METGLVRWKFDWSGAKWIIRVKWYIRVKWFYGRSGNIGIIR
jgi:hypothetical protein